MQSFLPRDNPSRRAAGPRSGLLALVLLLGSGCAPSSPPPPEVPPESSRVVVAVAEQPISASVLLADSGGFFAERGLDVEILRRATGSAALAEVLSGRAHLATTAETPVVHAVLRGEEVAVIATVATTREGFRLVARRDRGITSPLDLAGRRIGVTKATNVEFFLDLFLTLERVDRDGIEQVHVGGDDVVSALTSGRVDSVMSWQPHTMRLREELGDEAVFFQEPDIYTWFWNLATTRAFVEDHPRTTELFLEGLVLATEALVEDPRGTLAAAALVLGVPEEELRETRGQTRFSVSLDQALILSMEDQVRWLTRSAEGDGSAMPNFLEVIEPGPLRRVAPQAVFLIGEERP